MKTGEVCKRSVVTTVMRASLADVAKVMRDRGIRRLPVLDGAGELAGIVALDDLVESSACALFDVVQAIGTERVVEGQQRKAIP